MIYNNVSYANRDVFCEIKSPSISRWFYLTGDTTASSSYFKVYYVNVINTELVDLNLHYRYINYIVK